MAYAAAPKSKAEGLIERLSLAASGAAVDDFALRRLEQDARALMPADVAGARVVLGGVASLRWDLQGVYDHYRVALQHLDIPEVRYNYSVSLANVEERAPAATEAVRAQRKAPDHKLLLDHAIRACIDAGRFREADDLCSHWLNIVPGEHHQLASQIHDLAAAVDARVFSEEAVLQVLDILSDVQRRDKVRTAHSTVVADWDEPHCFQYTQFVYAPSDRCAHLDSDFVDRLVTQERLLADPGLHFTAMVISAG